MSDVPTTLAQAVVRLRAKSTQDDFAKLVDISPSMIGHVEAGTRNLSADSVDKIADALALSEGQRAELHRLRRLGVSRPDGLTDVVRQLQLDVLEQMQSMRQILQSMDERLARLEERPSGTGRESR